MTLHEIENMTAAEIKASRAELAEAIAAAPPEDLATRYVQARLDAKLRDEKLAEQGRTITLLSDGLESAKQQVAGTAQALAELTDQSGRALATAAENNASLTKRLDEFVARNSELAIRCDRLKTQASQHAAALGTILKLALESANRSAVDESEATGQ